MISFSVKNQNIPFKKPATEKQINLVFTRYVQLHHEQIVQSHDQATPALEVVDLGMYYLLMSFLVPKDLKICFGAKTQKLCTYKIHALAKGGLMHPCDAVC